jgi:hypothetical protein
VEFTAAKSDTHAEDAVSGLALDQTVQIFQQRYRLDFGRRIYPNLEFRTGGSYDADQTSTELLGESFDGSRKRFTPYFRLTLRTPTFGAEAAYDRRQERFEAGASTSKLVQETWRANLSWSPVDLPLTRLELSRRNTFDLGRAGIDTVEDRLQLSSRYLAVDRVDLTVAPGETFHFDFHWFDLRRDEQLSIGADGILRIRTFPGFWIDTAALMEQNVERLADCLDLGIATREHQDFVDLLAKRRRAARKPRGK